ncbi:MAG: DUF2156 domain-containing protein [Spirochaetales bacterium]|nr:DUF2156 domain-containing protein [Spirochaetales bacterium]
MNIPLYPQFEPLSFAMKADLHPRLPMNTDGVSEFTFAGLYLFRNTYEYKLSRSPGSCEHLLVSGEKDGKRFFMAPCGLPEDDTVLKELFQSHDFLKALSESNTEKERIRLEKLGFLVEEDRDNFDYLYEKKELAELPGKKFHKKRNLVQGFLNNYNFSECPLTPDNINDAKIILDTWAADREDKGDYHASAEALERMADLELFGYLVSVDGKPAAYTLGESLAKGKHFVIHFEKALSGYKGIYQFINKAFAQVLPRHYKYINREQDLGDPGLRQAKMTYRPAAFVKKYRVYPHP